MEFTKLSLLASNLTEMKDFYRNVLEMHISAESVKEFTVHVGQTDVTFRESDDGNPFYHFAINIPENKFNEAITWAKSRISLYSEDGNDEVHFASWNAHAIYFEDPSGNIVELIARHNLPNGTNNNFSSEDFLNVSEIGIAVDEVIPFVRKLNALGFPNWRNDSEGLTPVGDENGMFIVVKTERKWFFSNRYAIFHPVEVWLNGFGKLAFEKNGDKVEIIYDEWK
ncbi:ring-cleaving dioxygenase [Bacillus sp. FJAT-27445]|uniref:ring-cleaving dioxygenase n=1 Tax=Bacillus sp. FJAT-27445 TaxID=1679166 RepID=UPI000743AAC1|nr:ring-cleaving dioxygenase [Bacillus sp. FJAT-27445]